MDRSREQTCALLRHGSPKKCGPRYACHQDDSSSDAHETGRAGTKAALCEINSGASLSGRTQVWPALSCTRVASVKVVETLSGPIESGRLRCRWSVKNLLRAAWMDGRMDCWTQTSFCQRIMRRAISILGGRTGPAAGTDLAGGFCTGQAGAVFPAWSQGVPGVLAGGGAEEID